MSSNKEPSSFREYRELNHRPTSSTFLKFAQTDQTPVIQSIIYFEKQDASNHFLHQLNRLHSAATTLDYPHFWPYQVFHQASESFNVVLERQFFNDHLSDRLLSRPFLDVFEKSWYSYQLLLGLVQMRKHSLFHLDINSRNILTTCWGWLVFADFAFHKPSHIPADNSHMFSLFYDAGDNRTCTLAPERFTGTSSQHDKSTKPNEISFLLGSDIFSTGCILAEIFLDGEPLFTLSNLHKYRLDSIPPKSLSQIPSKFRKIIKGMIDLNPESRLTPEEVLQSNIFPDYFPALNDFIGSLLYIHPNRRLEWISLYLESHPDFYLPSKFLVHFSRFLILCASPNDISSFISIVERVNPSSDTIELLLPYLFFSINPVSQNPAINRQPAWRAKIIELVASLIPKLKPTDSLLEIVTDFIFPFLKKHLKISSAMEYGAILKLLPLTKLCPLHHNVKEFFDILIHSPLASEHPFVLEGLLRYLCDNPSGALGHFIHENLLPTFLPIMNSPPKPIKQMYLIQDPVDPTPENTLQRHYTSFEFSDEYSSSVLLSPNTDIHRSFKFLFYSLLPSFSNFLWENDSPYILPLIIQGLLDSEPFIVSHAISTLIALIEVNRLSWQDLSPLAQFLAHNISRLENTWIQVPFLTFIKKLYSIKPHFTPNSPFAPVFASIAHIFGGSSLDPSSLKLYNSWVSFVQPQTISSFRACFINNGSPIPLVYRDSVTLSNMILPQALPFSFRLPTESLTSLDGFSSNHIHTINVDGHSNDQQDSSPPRDSLAFISLATTPLQLPSTPPRFFPPNKDFFTPLLNSSTSLLTELASNSVPSILYEAKKSPLDRYRVSGGKNSESFNTSAGSSGFHRLRPSPKEKPFLGCTLATIRDHSGVITSLSTIPFSTVFASGSSDGTVKLWNFSRLNPPLPKVPTSSFASIPLSDFGPDVYDDSSEPNNSPTATMTKQLPSQIVDLETIEGEYLCIGTKNGLLHTLSLARGSSSSLSWSLDRSLYSNKGIEKLHTFPFDSSLLFISNHITTSTYDFRSSEPSLHFDFPQVFDDSSFVDLVHFENTWSVAACFESGAFSLYDLRFPVVPVTLSSNLGFRSVYPATGYSPCKNHNAGFSLIPAGLTPQTGIFCTFDNSNSIKHFPSLLWDRKFILPHLPSESLAIWDLDSSSTEPMWQSQPGLISASISALGRIQTDAIPAIVVGTTDGTISLIS